MKSQSIWTRQEPMCIMPLDVEAPAENRMVDAMRLRSMAAEYERLAYRWLALQELVHDEHRRIVPMVAKTHVILRDADKLIVHPSTAFCRATSALLGCLHNRRSRLLRIQLGDGRMVRWVSWQRALDMALDMQGDPMLGWFVAWHNAHGRAAGACATIGGQVFAELGLQRKSEHRDERYVGLRPLISAQLDAKRKAVERIISAWNRSAAKRS